MVDTPRREAPAPARPRRALPAEPPVAEPLVAEPLPEAPLDPPPRRVATFDSLRDRNFRWCFGSVLAQTASLNMQHLVRGSSRSSSPARTPRSAASTSPAPWRARCSRSPAACSPNA